MVSAEVTPFAKVGGLSQVVGNLSYFLNKQGLDVRVFTPKYGIIDEKKYNFEIDSSQIEVYTGAKGKNPLKPKSLICNVKYYIPAKKNYPRIYLLENREYFELRSNIYGYSDEHVRFYLLSAGALTWVIKQIKEGKWIPDIIHCHDWHTGYLIELAKTHPRYKRYFAHIKILYTVHNFRHQGNYNFQYGAHKDSGKKPLLNIFSDKLQFQNAMLRGIIYCDHLNTVSQTHSKEIQTKEFGEGLDKHLRNYSKKISGITNGIDINDLNPLKDKNIKYHYSKNDITQKIKNKAILQKLFKLPINKNIPMIGYIGRFAPQKGIEIILKALSRINVLPKVQFVFLGSGEENYYNELKKYCEQNPDQISSFLFKDFLIPRKIFAGADIIVMPSNFEPGGIVAMEAMRYGCVPIVSDTGGLSESVKEFNLASKIGNGFKFIRKDFWSFFVALITALKLYEDPNIWNIIVKNAMNKDFSWKNSAIKYKKLYHLLHPLDKS